MFNKCRWVNSPLKFLMYWTCRCELINFDEFFAQKVMGWGYCKNAVLTSKRRDAETGLWPQKLWEERRGVETRLTSDFPFLDNMRSQIIALFLWKKGLIFQKWFFFICSYLRLVQGVLDGYKSTEMTEVPLGPN